MNRFEIDLEKHGTFVEGHLCKRWSRTPAQDVYWHGRIALRDEVRTCVVIYHIADGEQVVV